MIFTIGNKKTYENYFELCKHDARVPIKKGKSKGYQGGSVWRTAEEATRYLERNDMNETHSVYGVLASWDDTSSNKHFCFNNLLHDAELVKIRKTRS